MHIWAKGHRPRSGFQPHGQDGPGILARHLLSPTRAFAWSMRRNRNVLMPQWWQAGGGVCGSEQVTMPAIIHLAKCWLVLPALLLLW